MSIIVPALMLCVRDRVIPIKLASERAMMYILGMKSGAESEILKAYLGTLEGNAGRSIGDYARRVLSKLGENDSDED
jgi:hypothetical protein